MKQSMKLTFFLVLSIIAFLPTSCSKDKEEENTIIFVQDKAGEIPGLGETEGESTGKNFELPEGIQLIGEITGYEGDMQPISKRSTAESIRASLSRNFLKSSTQDNSITMVSIGSGAYVRLGIKLQNTTSNDKIVELPAGLIIKSRSGTYQNGVLLKKVTVSIKANNQLFIDLYMYCGNVSKSASSSTEKYDFGVISNSSSLHELIELLKNKKINIEQFFGQENGLYEYSDIITLIQDILWKITDSEDGLQESDIEEIKGLQND